MTRRTLALFFVGIPVLWLMYAMAVLMVEAHAAIWSPKETT